VKCPQCQQGPLGPEGHLDLFVFRMGGGRMQFRCRTCTALWLRTPQDTSYRWAESREGLDAPTVPGMYHDAPPRSR
jgi:hypothetical protein